MEYSFLPLTKKRLASRKTVGKQFASQKTVGKLSEKRKRAEYTVGAHCAHTTPTILDNTHWAKQQRRYLSKGDFRLVLKYLWALCLDGCFEEGLFLRAPSKSGGPLADSWSGGIGGTSGREGMRHCLLWHFLSDQCFTHITPHAHAQQGFKWSGRSSICMYTYVVMCTKKIWMALTNRVKLWFKALPLI